MAIAPIDIQTLYTQLDKVSKNVVQQQQGAALQSSMVMDAKMQKEIEHQNVVNETKKDEKSNDVKNDKKGSSGNSNQKKDEKQDKPKQTHPEQFYIKDPSLGNNLDVFG